MSGRREEVKDIIYTGKEPFDKFDRQVSIRIVHHDLLLAEESGRERLITAAFLPCNAG